MEEADVKRGELGYGGHFMVAITGSGNSEYLIRWTNSTTRRLNATWTALHVHNPDQEDDPARLGHNLSMAKDLGAEIISIVDNDVASSIVRYARIKKSTALVIGKTDGDPIPLLGKRSIMDEILGESGDLDVIILKGTIPVPSRRPRSLIQGPVGPARGIATAAAGLAAVTALGLLAQPALGYRSVSILYLLTIISLPFACNRMVVFVSASASALLWNFLFIPPKLTFSITSLEDVLMFTAFFLAAFVGGFLTSRLKEKESALSLRERRMAFLYGFTRAISRVRGIEEVARFTGEYLLEHLDLQSAVCLRGDDGTLDTSSIMGNTVESARNLGLDVDLARRCFDSKECVSEGDNRLYLPLGSQESVMGMLYVTGGRERVIKGESREILATLAGNVALTMERELLAAQNERNKMAGETARLSKILLNHVSHELRTPLTTIKGAVSGLLDDNAVDDPRLQNELLMETMIAANKLNVLVEDLLAMSRLEAGRMSPRTELVYLNELVGAAQASSGLDLSGRIIILGESAKDFEFEADPVLIMQVIRNIIRNFATYTVAGSTLHIEAAVLPGFHSMRFEDDGPGVPERELPRLFDTFYRGSSCGGKQGCGLGLSICKGIVEVHGGTIEAGTSVYGGLLVLVTLPGKAHA